MPLRDRRPPPTPGSAPPTEAVFQRIWRRRGWEARALWPVAAVYGALSALRGALYRSGVLRTDRLPVPVVVVGNVVAGGAGKTPVTQAVVRALRERGWHPGVVSRGYGRTTTDCREVLPDADASAVGDEPLLLARSTGAPVFVAARRAEAARALLRQHPRTDVVVCDDGLQHLALARDVELCVFSEEGAGNGWLLPAGPLREPWPRRVDAVLYAGNAPEEAGTAALGAFPIHRSLADHAVARDGGTVPLARLHGQPLHAVAAIARPDAFFGMLRGRGLTVERETALPDHADYGGWPPGPGDGLQVVCTEKDATKLWKHCPGALAVPLVMEIAPAFYERLHLRLRELAARSLSSAPDS